MASLEKASYQMILKHGELFKAYLEIKHKASTEEEEK